MLQIFGEFNPNQLKSREYLMMEFYQRSTNFDQIWRNNGLSADFLANYLTTFLYLNDIEILRKNKVKESVNYIANELLENAMKFNDNSDLSVRLQFHLSDDHLNLSVTNSVAEEKASQFQLYIHKLLNSSPQDLRLEQLRISEKDETMMTSGLGLLTMIGDADLQVGWKFERVANLKKSSVMLVTTMVRVNY